MIVGLGGEPEHAETFRRWAGSLVDHASGRLGIPQERILYLLEDPQQDPKRAHRARRPRTRSRERASAALGAAAKDDVVFIVLIGHGTSDGKVAKFNLPGPDMTAADFAAILKGFGTKNIVFVNIASSSGPFIEALAGAGPRRRDRDPQWRRAVRHAVRRLLHRRARQRRRRCRQEPAGLGARGVQRGKERRRPRLPAARRHADRTRACSRTAATAKAAWIRRSTARTAASPPMLSLGAPSRGAGAAGRSEAAAALRRAARARAAGRSAEAAEGEHAAGAVRRRAREGADRPGPQEPGDPGASKGRANEEDVSSALLVVVGHRRRRRRGGLCPGRASVASRAAAELRLGQHRLRRPAGVRPPALCHRLRRFRPPRRRP